MSDKPYLLLSDMHFHSWSTFSTTNADGMNSRLAISLEELLRAAEELKLRGGDMMIAAGDAFHCRGQIDPEVFNPVHSTFVKIAEMGIEIWIIPGNHDLKGKDTNELGNAVQTLGRIVDCHVVTTSRSITTDIAMIPWCSSLDDLRAKAKALKATFDGSVIEHNAWDFDLIIHAGIDGVLPGVPNAGLSSAEVASWGFKRVFAGHYHNHKIMEDGKVISIGATTHQQWGDIGSKAGFLFVYPDRVEWQASHAPSFIELTADIDPDEFPLVVDGNYVRVRGMKLTDPEIKKFRAELEEMGARGVTFQVARAVTTLRAGATAGKATTLDESVNSYIETLEDIDVAAVKAGCAEVLATVRSIAA